MKTDIPGFIKDDTPRQVHAVLNIDNAALQAYKNARDKERMLAGVVEEVNNIKQDMSTIKQLLTQLLDRK